MSKIIQFYKNLLKVANFVTNEDGFIYNEFDDNITYLTIGGKKVLLPTPENLKRPDIDNYVILHFLPENTARLSPDIDRIKGLINDRLNTSVIFLINAICGIMSDNTAQKNLSVEQVEFLSNIKTFDKTAAKHIPTAIMKLAHENISNAILNIFIKRGGTYKNERYFRVSNVTFPILNKINNKELSNSMRDKDYEILKNIIESIFPNCHVKEYYNSGSRDMNAPTIEALLRSTYLLASEINDVYYLFKDYLESIQLYQPIDTDVFDDMNNLNAIIEESKRIPNQSDDPTFAQPQVQANTVPVNNNPYMQIPQTQQTISPLNEDDTVNLNKLALANPALVPFSGYNTIMANPNMMNPRANPTPRFLANYMPQVPVVNTAPWMGNTGFVNPNTVQMQNQFGVPVNPNQNYQAPLPGRSML